MKVGATTREVQSPTFQVLEDTNIVNRIGTSFWEIQFPTCSESEEPSSSPSQNEPADDEGNIVFEDVDHNAVEGMMSREIDCLSDGNLELTTKEIDELYGLCDELDVRALEDNWIMSGSFEVMSSPEAASVSDAERITDDVVTLSYSFQSSRSSCFTPWKRSSDSLEDVAASVAGESQKLLKKSLAGGAWTNGGGGGTARARESNVKGHVMSERRRREKLNEMFLILKSLVPSMHKVDKASILAETIAYLKQLEQRVEELEFSRALSRPVETAGRKRHDVAGKILAGSKRKASEFGDANTEKGHLSKKDDGSSNVVNVTVMDKEVLLEVQCRWKELLMTRVFDALKALSLDVQSVQSSTPGGLLALKIRAQHADSAAVAPGMITEALQRAIGKD
ncbi:hypothetical protein QYE76_045533 [Lolium multiflorum]|uniref:BHLH domain-containing protein n=1 Tax=Lolium multiflorum TaxID=4521 RepID=A0AAD8TL72_LOLMU|nr:hypothetical protein QYE76_045533 [Lolium multiflorum]